MINTLLNLLFPNICNGCNNTLSAKEKIICTTCRHHLPIASYHKTGATTMKDVFYGRIPVEEATALVLFQKKGITQELLHNLKYRNQEQISHFFGRWLGAELAEIEAYAAVDLIIPVPLHKKRKRKRGYNQVSGFGKEIAAALKKPYCEDILIKVSKTDSQVFKGRLKRTQDKQHFTLVKPEKINNKHILLVDDIVTTGATLENCAQQLLNNTNAKISLATMAISL